MRVEERPGIGGRRRISWFPYLSLFLAVLWVVAFTLYPLLSALWYSLNTYVLGRGIVGFVGLGNYREVLASQEFWHSLGVSLLYALLAAPLETALGFGLAWLVHLRPPGYRAFQAIFLAPLFAMDVAVGYLGVTLFSQQGGLLDHILRRLGLEISWLSSTWGGLAGGLILDIWLWTSFCFLVSLAGLSTLNEEMYEAALLETKSSWTVAFRIALPVIWPVLSLAFLIRFLEALKTFGLVYALTSGGPGTSTLLLSPLVYLTTVRFFNFGHGSAMGFLFLVLASVFIALFFRQLRRVVEA